MGQAQATLVVLGSPQGRSVAVCGGSAWQVLAVGETRAEGQPLALGTAGGFGFMVEASSLIGVWGTRSWGPEWEYAGQAGQGRLGLDGQWLLCRALELQGLWPQLA